MRIRKQAIMQNKIIFRGLFQMQLATPIMILLNQVWQHWHVSGCTHQYSKGTVHIYFLFLMDGER